MLVKKDNLCFVEFGASHLSLVVCKIVSSRIENILFFQTSKIKVQPYRYENIFEMSQLYIELIKLISQAEKETKTSIFDIIVIATNKAIQVSSIQKMFDFHKKQKIQQTAIEKILNSTIKDFCTRVQGQEILVDFVCNNYVLDNNKVEKNPYKILSQNICIYANIVSIKQVFEVNLSSYLEKYKIRIKHYISPCFATYCFIKNLIDKKNIVLLVNIGSYTTEYCVANNDNVIFHSVINRGGFDISKEISQKLNCLIQEADRLKCKSAEAIVSKIESKTTKDLIQHIENIKHTFLSQLAREIRIKASKKCLADNMIIKEIILFGGTSKYKNIKQIFENEFCATTKIITDSIYNDIEIPQVFSPEMLKKENLPIISAINFYCSNLESYRKAKYGFLFKMPSKISCILKDILY